MSLVEKGDSRYEAMKAAKAAQAARKARATKSLPTPMNNTASIGVNTFGNRFATSVKENTFGNKFATSVKENTFGNRFTSSVKENVFGHNPSFKENVFGNKFTVQSKPYARFRMQLHRAQVPHTRRSKPKRNQCDVFEPLEKFYKW